MKIENLTSNSVPLKSFIRTVNGMREFTRTICPKGVTHIEEESTYPDLMRLYEAGVLAINGKTYKAEEHVEAVATVADSTEVQDTSEPASGEDVADSTDTPEEAVPENASEFTCPHCHAEFASSRGLAMHLKKSHPEVSE